MPSRIRPAERATKRDESFAPILSKERSRQTINAPFGICFLFTAMPKSILRISLFVVCAAAGLAQAPQARIKIDTDRKIGEVHPYLFGNFAEHLGRCIYGGIYEEGSPLSDDKGFRKDVMEATKGLGVSLLRWPGGNFVSGYNWKDGIGPKDQRPARPDQ